ncbi:MAG: HRDC domain-containing protein, partial [Clostridia bacterium]|nr:HRDC domain-containing protein [Clostridia bacterium]
MERDVELFEALYLLRQQIREREKAKTGRTPTVCPDDALREMTRLMPKKASDFYSIAGVGPAFVENFAPEFLAVINGDKVSGGAAQVSDHVEETLRELSKKLININKTNRMLFLPKLAAKYAVDLFDANGRYNPLDILFSATEPMVISEAADQDLPRTNPARERYKNLVNLIRESSRDMRDKGQNDLYIGYPFVQGCLSNGEFGIRAPLCLFPVTLDRSTTSISIALDPTRDVVYNSTLILAHYKFNSITSPMPDCVPEEINPDTFLQELLDFYSSNDIRIEYNSDELKKFTEYPGETFPKYTRGTLKLVHNIVIGKFPAYSNSIQRDFEQILNKGLVNRLVSDLVSDYGTIDFYSDHDDTKNDLDPRKSIPEDSLVYINALNSAQETVLHALNTTDELVVEGPPGTGKSQTITSLITQFVNQGKNVLMVSEKKTALDVVYSRLGTLSRYAVMMDDANNKNLFYSQLERLLLSTDANAPIEAPDLSPISAEIDTDVATLEIIADKLFKPGEFGV